MMRCRLASSVVQGGVGARSASSQFGDWFSSKLSFVILADVDGIASSVCCLALAWLVLNGSFSTFVVRNCIMFL